MERRIVRIVTVDLRSNVTQLNVPGLICLAAAEQLTIRLMLPMGGKTQILLRPCQKNVLIQRKDEMRIS